MILAAVSFGAGLVVVGAAAPASAHTGDLFAETVCDADTGQYTVTYTLELTQVDKNLAGSTKWRIGDTGFDGTPGSDKGLDRGPIASKGNAVVTLGTQTLPGSTTGSGPWVYAYTTWSDRYGKGSDGRVENLKGDCGTGGGDGGGGDQVVDVPATPAAEDLCGTADDGVPTPPAIEGVSWQVTAVVDGAATAVATTLPGYVFADGRTSETFAFAFTDVACTPASLAGSVATGVCEADVPWISYRIRLTDPDHRSTSREAFLVMTDGSDSVRIPLGEIDAQTGVLEDRVLWPGASVDADGTPTGWPGWMQNSDGTWVETTGNFAWTRALTTATIEVNPDLAVDVSYPPATPDCATGPVGGPTALASTGFNGGPIAIIAGIIVLAGAAFIVVAVVRKRTRA